MDTAADVWIPGLSTALELAIDDLEFLAAIPSDDQGWGGTHEIFDRLVSIGRPSLAIEVGTWKGRSAMTTARALRRERLHSSRLLCVDSWLGATEFIGVAPDDPKRGLRQRIGWPNVYYQFMANLYHAGLLGSVIPFPQTSTNAARYLSKHGVRADLIYIDGSHEYEDVLDDMRRYSRLLTDDGIMFGDDYCPYWQGVIDAVGAYVDMPIGLPYDPVLQTFSYPNGPNEPRSDYWVISPDGVTL